jgi:hypothetical protein
MMEVGSVYRDEEGLKRGIEEIQSLRAAYKDINISDKGKAFNYELMEAIELGPHWLEEVLSIVSLKDEVDRVKKQRLDGIFPDEEYHRQKRLLEMELESLVVPEANAAEEAGKLINDLAKLWAGANLGERRKLLLTMLDAVYVDAKEEALVASKVVSEIFDFEPKP